MVTEHTRRSTFSTGSSGANIDWTMNLCLLCSPESLSNGCSITRYKYTALVLILLMSYVFTTRCYVSTVYATAMCVLVWPPSITCLCSLKMA